MRFIVGCLGATIFSVAASAFAIWPDVVSAAGHDCQVVETKGVPTAQANFECLLAKLEALKIENDNLRSQIEEIKLTPGPKGDTGEQGPSGPPGLNGTDARIPSGAVVASTLSCDKWGEGWSPYFPAAGRFIIGAGPHHSSEPEIKNRDQNGKPLVQYVGPGDLSQETLRTPSAANTSSRMRVGGAETHTLIEAEMPNHNHLPPSRGNSGPYEVNALQATGKGHFRGNHARPTSFSGGGKPHNNMPPFLALYFCEKG